MSIAQFTSLSGGNWGSSTAKRARAISSNTGSQRGQEHRAKVDERLSPAVAHGKATPAETFSPTSIHAWDQRMYGVRMVNPRSTR
jgi:hypothetical protein